MGTKDQRLRQYLATQRGKSFALGEHDCFTFTNEAWRAMHGAGYADGIIGKYADLGPSGFRKLLNENFGAPDLIDALDLNLVRVDGVPPRGALVVQYNGRWLTRHALGIACGTVAAFLSDDDVLFIDIDKINGAWV